MLDLNFDLRPAFTDKVLVPVPVLTVVSVSVSVSANRCIRYDYDYDYNYDYECRRYELRATSYEVGYSTPPNERGR